MSRLVEAAEGEEGEEDVGRSLRNERTNKQTTVYP